MEKRHSPPASRFFAIKSKFLRAASVLAALAAAALATSVSPLLSDSMAGTAESCFGKQSERNSTRKRNPESGSPAATLILFFLTELTTDQRQFTLICEALFWNNSARSTALVQFTVRNRLLFNHLSNHSITKLHFLLSVTRLTNEPALARGHFLETGPQQTSNQQQKPVQQPLPEPNDPPQHTNYSTQKHTSRTNWPRLTDFGSESFRVPSTSTSSYGAEPLLRPIATNSKL